MPERSNPEWLAHLRSAGPEQQEAIEDLRRALERAALFYIRRRAPGLKGAATDELESLAQDAAQEATLQVLDKLDSFRGESRFLTWASAIAVGRAMTALRRRLWQDVSLDRMPNGWQEPANIAISANGWEHPDLAAERQEMWDVIRDVVARELTQRQRDVLNQLVLNGANAEEVAERLGTSPGALYKMTHDARRKLKAGLLKRGFSTDEILDAFAAAG
ncbi:MAG TPA: sigma-70 family RNA polymerase sigma factor [Dehalococcoidia bacterium]|nr:sigma-70 family RNA polymerase sigma factor [Dehalococcoidia bacterium]